MFFPEIEYELSLKCIWHEILYFRNMQYIAVIIVV